MAQLSPLFALGAVSSGVRTDTADRPTSLEAPSDVGPESSVRGAFCPAVAG